MENVGNKCLYDYVLLWQLIFHVEFWSSDVSIDNLTIEKVIKNVEVTDKKINKSVTDS